MSRVAHLEFHRIRWAVVQVWVFSSMQGIPLLSTSPAPCFVGGFMEEPEGGRLDRGESIGKGCCMHIA